MDKVYDYGAAAATTGVASFLLAKLLSGGTADKSVGGMSIATAVGLASAAGSVAAKVAHDQVLPRLPQSEKWISAESAALNAAASGGGAIAACYLIAPETARSDALPIAAYAIGGEMLGGYVYQNYIAPIIPHPRP